MNAIHADKFPSKPKHLYLGRYGWYYTGGPETAWMRGAVYLTQCRTCEVARTLGLFQPRFRAWRQYRGAEDQAARDTVAHMVRIWRRNARTAA